MPAHNLVRADPTRGRRDAGRHRECRVARSWFGSQGGDSGAARRRIDFWLQCRWDVACAYLGKINRDGSATWESLEYMGIAQSIPMRFKTAYDFL
jgi:hypothetical protein